MILYPRQSEPKAANSILVYKLVYINNIIYLSLKNDEGLSNKIKNWSQMMLCMVLNSPEFLKTILRQSVIGKIFSYEIHINIVIYGGIRELLWADFNFFLFN